jgi:pre-mRNA-splicing helicase BRR2
VIDLSKFKIVYLAPMKALVAEMVLTFSKRLERNLKYIIYTVF